jgi:hypothetical protein
MLLTAAKQIEKKKAEEEEEENNDAHPTKRRRIDLGQDEACDTTCVKEDKTKSDCLVIAPRLTASKNLHRPWPFKTIEKTL